MQKTVGYLAVRILWGLVAVFARCCGVLKQWIKDVVWDCRSGYRRVEYCL